MEDLILLIAFMMGLCAALLIAAGIAALAAVYYEWRGRPRFRTMAVPMKRIRFWNL
jgi:hypothetical protein